MIHIGRRPTGMLGVAIVAALLSLLPLFLVAIPPILDYPNHIARCYIADHYQQLSSYQAFYRPNHIFVPDLGIDIAVGLLSALMPTLVAGKVFLFTVQLLTTFGTIALNFSLYRRWSLWPVAVCLLLFNFPFDYGFVNYSLGVALLLWAMAAYVATHESGLAIRAVTALVAGAVLMVVHLMPFVLFGMSIFFFECGWAKGKPRRTAANGFAASLLPLFGLLILLRLVTPGTNELSHLSFCPLRERFYYWIDPLSATATGPDVAYFLCLLLATLALLATRVLTLDRRMILPIVGICMAAIFAPETGRALSFIGARLPIVVLLFFVASSKFYASPNLTRAVAVAGLLLLAVRTAMVSHDWRQKVSVTAAMQKDLESMPAESLMLITDATRHRPTGRFGGEPPWQWHVALLQLLQKPVMAPTFFGNPIGEPVVFQEKYTALGRFPSPIDAGSVDQILDEYETAHPLAKTFGHVVVVVDHYHDPQPIASKKGRVRNTRDYTLIFVDQSHPRTNLESSSLSSKAMHFALPRK